MTCNQVSDSPSVGCSASVGITVARLSRWLEEYRGAASGAIYAIRMTIVMIVYYII